MKVLITGGLSGQLKQELLRSVPDGYTLVENQQRLDICDTAAVSSALENLQPDWVINAAAYTAVDRAESEQAQAYACLLYTSPSPRDGLLSRMPSSA